MSGPERPTIPGYSIERLLGEGAHGRVFLARETGGLKRPVALKVFAPAYRDKFERERRRETADDPSEPGRHAHFPDHPRRPEDARGARDGEGGAGEPRLRADGVAFPGPFHRRARRAARVRGPGLRLRFPGSRARGEERRAAHREGLATAGIVIAALNVAIAALVVLAIMVWAK